MKGGKTTSKKAVTNEDMYKVLLSVDARVTNIEERLSDMATKDHVETVVESATEKIKNEILREVRPIAKAVDKDAETIIRHEKRITRIEQHLAVK